MSQSQQPPTQSGGDPNRDTDVDHNLILNSSFYKEAHDLAVGIIGNTNSELTKEEHVLYVLDVVRYSVWQAIGLMLVRKGIAGPVEPEHVKVAMMSLGNAETWKARRKQWAEFTAARSGVKICEWLTGGARASSEPSGSRPSDDDDDEEEGEEDTVMGEKSEYDDDDDDDDEEEYGRMMWEDILATFQAVQEQVKEVEKKKENKSEIVIDYEEVKDVIRRLKYRLEEMVEVFEPFTARLKNALQDLKEVDKTLYALKQESVGTNRGDQIGISQHQKRRRSVDPMEQLVSYTDELSLTEKTTRLFSAELKSLVLNLEELCKMFVAHGIPSYVGQDLSAEDKLDSMHDMLTSEVTRMIHHRGADEIHPVVMEKLNTVVGLLATLEEMFEAAIKRNRKKKMSTK